MGAVESWLSFAIALVFCPVVSFVAWISFGAARDAWREAGRAATTPITPIRSIEAGRWCQVEGVLEAKGTTVVSPWDGRECLYCKTDVREYEVNRSRDTIASRRMATQAWLRDETGRVTVRIDGEVTIDGGRRIVRSWRRWSKVPDRIRQLAMAHGRKAAAHLRVELWELRICPGDHVHIQGEPQVGSAADWEPTNFRGSARPAVFGAPSAPCRVSLGRRGRTVLRDRAHSVALVLFGLAMVGALLLLGQEAVAFVAARLE